MIFFLKHLIAKNLKNFGIKKKKIMPILFLIIFIDQRSEIIIRSPPDRIGVRSDDRLQG